MEVLNRHRTADRTATVPQPPREWLPLSVTLCDGLTVTTLAAGIVLMGGPLLPTRSGLVNSLKNKITVTKNSNSGLDSALNGTKLLVLIYLNYPLIRSN